MVNMKCILLISLVVSQEVLMYAPCIGRLCAQEFNPVCGKQKIGDCWDVQIFNSSCLMDAANDCGKANYVPCVENKCGELLELP